MQRSNKRRHLSRERSPSKRTKRHANHDGSKGFDSLPDELILHIVHHALRSQNRVSTLTSFALTSRRPSRIVTPILYTTCNNSTGDSAKFLRTIINAPHLANMISDIHWVYGRQDDMKLLDSQLDHTERRELYHKLNDPGPSSTGTGSSVFAPSNIFVPRKSRDYLVAVMLLAPKLSFLDISDGLMQFPCMSFYETNSVPAWVHIVSDVAIGKSAKLAQHFQNLHTMRLRMGRLCLQHVSGILRLPSLRILGLEGAPESSFALSTNWNCPARTSPLQDLFLDTGFISSQAIA